MYAKNIHSTNLVEFNRLNSEAIKYRTKFDNLNVKYNQLKTSLYLKLGRKKYKEFMGELK